MPSRNSFIVALVGGLMSVGLNAQTLPSPPADLPAGEGPRGTSQGAPGEDRYDAVGYAVLDRSAGEAMGVTHASLPVGSFVEITSLDTGKTIVALVTGAGPRVGGAIIGMSPGAAQLLGVIGPSSPVRVRRTEPSQPDQIALRAGHAGSDRLDAPKVLISALRKRLPSVPRLTDAIVLPRPTPVRPEPQRSPPRTGAAYALPEPDAPSPAQAAVRPASRGVAGTYFVQIIAVSNAARANAIASESGGLVVSGGGIYRVRLGPYHDARSAQNARDAAARQGYADARIVHDQ